MIASYYGSALMQAVLFGNNIDLIKFLLNNKAAVNSRDYWGKTALMYAAEYNKKDVVEILINAGADINIKDANGETVLSLATNTDVSNIIISTVEGDTNYLKYQEMGIKEYKNKNNIEAEKYLLKSLDLNTNGRSYYYLGNVEMNLSNFNEAINDYEQSWYSHYEISNSMYNIACANSLLNENDKALVALLHNYFVNKDYRTNRIYSDSDLQNFRRSPYFDSWKKLLSYPVAGTIPKNGNEVISAIKSKFFLAPPIMGGCFYLEDDSYYRYIGHGDTGFTEKVGKWAFDDSKSEFIMFDIGIIKNKHEGDDFEDRFNNKIMNSSVNYEWVSNFTDIKTNFIKYKDIRLNAREVSVWYDMFGELDEYHIIGRFKIGTDISNLIK